jgi:hypothetical protein
MVKIANEPVWGVTGVQAGHFVLAQTAGCKAVDDSRQLLTLAYCSDSLSGLSMLHTKPLYLLDVSLGLPRFSCQFR